MNDQSSSSGVIIGVLIVLVVLIIGFIAYKQGFFQGSSTTNDNNPALQIQLSGSGDNGGNNPAQ